MPCSYDGPSQEEIAWDHLNELLREAKNKKPVRYTGRRDAFDNLAAELCEWCRNNDVTTKSLELQIWWRDHQRADAKREAHEREMAETRLLADKAIQKLTPKELDALRRILGT